ncbi:MAG: branched-chain amino acid aminotransferase [Clostridiales bacterium]|nr:branched-chain amino acid aminotransferase [Clostridiales bacterium]
MNLNDIKITKTASPKAKPADQTQLGFGRIFTDHMFLMDYTKGTGWHDPRIVPYQNLSLDPAAMVLHYGQAVFEGLKAYRAKDGEILLFRPQMNFARLNASDERLCIPELDETFALEALKALIRLEQSWIPTAEGTSLYIRPFVIATDPYVGVRPSNTYLFIIILSPVGAYYPEGLNPVKIFVETDYVRAVRGGLGFTKAAANYAASLKSQEKAKELGFSQVLWLDGIHRKYIEEVGTMNVFFKIAGKLATPALQGSILPGVTRDSAISLLKKFGYAVEERQITIDELLDAYRDGTLEEAFGTGTAAVVCPIGELIYGDVSMPLSGGKIGPVSQKLYDTLTGIQWGTGEDSFGWAVRV